MYCYRRPARPRTIPPIVAAVPIRPLPGNVPTPILPSPEPAPFDATGCGRWLGIDAVSDAGIGVKTIGEGSTADEASGVSTSTGAGVAFGAARCFGTRCD